MKKTNVAIVVLAAGRSTRMGQPKQLLSIENSTLLATVLVQALGSRAAKVFCVLGASSDQIQTSIAHLDIEVIVNPDFDQGLSSSVRAGVVALDAQGFDSALLVLGDQPEIDSAYLDELIEAQEGCSTKIVASSYDGRAGVPALVPREYFSELATLKGDKGAQLFLNGKAVVLIEGGCLIDLDSADDYQRYLES